MTWGNEGFGGDSHEVQQQLQHVWQVRASKGAFAAITAEGHLLQVGGDVFFFEGA